MGFFAALYSSKKPKAAAKFLLKKVPVVGRPAAGQVFPSEKKVERTTMRKRKR